MSDKSIREPEGEMSISYPMFTINQHTVCYIINKEFITTDSEGPM